MDKFLNFIGYPNVDKWNKYNDKNNVISYGEINLGINVISVDKIIPPRK